MKHQYIDVQLKVTLKMRLPSDNLLPTEGPFCKDSLIRHETQRWVRATMRSKLINPERTDIGPVHMSVEDLP